MADQSTEGIKTLAATFNTAMNQIQTQVSKFSNVRDIQSAGDALKKYTMETQSLQKAMTEGKIKFSEYSSKVLESTNTLNAAKEQYSAAFKKLASVTNDVTSATDAYNKELTNAKNKMNEFRDSVMGSMSSVVGGVSKLLGGDLTSIILKAGDDYADAAADVFDVKLGSAVKKMVAATAGGVTDFIVATSKLERGFRDTIIGMSASVGGLGKLQTNFDAFSITASQTINTMIKDFSVGAEETEKMMQDLSNAGFKELNSSLDKTVESVYVMGKALGMSTTDVTGFAATFKHEFGTGMKESLAIMNQIGKSSRNANVSQRDYIRSVMETTVALKDYNVSWKTVDKYMGEATQKGLGFARSAKYASEMSGGLAGMDLGKRAFAAQQAGYGHGDILGAAAMIKYGEGGKATTQEFINTMLSKNGGNSDYIKSIVAKGSSATREEREKAFGMAQKTAMATGLDERVVMENLNLVKEQKSEAAETNDKLDESNKILKAQLTALEYMSKGGKGMDALAAMGIHANDKEANMLTQYKKDADRKEKELEYAKKSGDLEKISSAQDSYNKYSKRSYEAVDTVFKAHSGDESSKKALVAMEDEAKKESDKELLKNIGTAASWIAPGGAAINLGKMIVPQKHHSGGLIKQFDNGGSNSYGSEIHAIMQKGEYVMPRSTVGMLGERALDHLKDTGKLPGNGSGSIDVNIYGNIGDLQSVIQDAVTSYITKSFSRAII